MAEIVYGLATSHDPQLLAPTTSDEGPGSDFKRFKDAFGRTRERFDAAAPDVIVTLSNDHLTRTALDCVPAYTISVGEQARGTSDGELVSKLLADHPAGAGLSVPAPTIDIDTDLARHVLHAGLEGGVDFAAAYDPQLEHAEVFPLSFLTPQFDVPIVNITTNVFAPPLPSLRRSQQVGALLRRAIENWPADRRVAVIGAGGLTHWVGTPETGRSNPEFDRWFMDCVVRGALDEVCDRYPSTEELVGLIGNGGQEIRSWVAAAAAMPPTLRARAVAYEQTFLIGLGMVDWTAAGNEADR